MDETLKAVVFAVAIVCAVIESVRSFKTGPWLGWLAIAIFIVPFMVDAINAPDV